jgi:hypothetical protein
MNWKVYCQYQQLITGNDVSQLTPLGDNNAKVKVQCAYDKYHDGSLFEQARTGDTKKNNRNTRNIWTQHSFTKQLFFFCWKIIWQNEWS